MLEGNIGLVIRVKCFRDLSKGLFWRRALFGEISTDGDQIQDKREFRAVADWFENRIFRRRPSKACLLPFECVCFQLCLKACTSLLCSKPVEYAVKNCQVTQV